MMAVGEHIIFAARVATVVVPIAAYFLTLGLLNSRSHPQALSGRLDFSLLIAALSPIFAVPVLHVVGTSIVSVLICVGAVCGTILLLAPTRWNWVVYNATADQVRHAVAFALRGLKLTWRMEQGNFVVRDPHATIRISCFPLLRNMSIRLEGPDELGASLGPRLLAELETMTAETSPSTMALLLVATAMLLAPLGLMADHNGQIVRTLTDLLQ